MNRSRHTGFTLIEVITVMVLIGALAGISALFIVEPFRAVDDMRRRAELVDEAQLITERMAREIRTALPNSVRIDSGGGRTGLEIVSTRTGGRYRRLHAPGGGGATLNRTQPSDTFDALGGLPGIGEVVTGSGGIDCATGNGDCINIYNTGQMNLNIYDDDNISKIVSTTDNAGTDRITHDNGGITPAFRQHSPQQRFFVVDNVISFICDGAADRMQRYSGYGFDTSQQLTPGGTVALMGRDVTACSFTYDQGTSSRSGLVTIDITIERDGETVRLFHQVHVMNAP